MPQIGHEPGSARTICGCIGQVHNTSPAAGRGATAMGVNLKLCDPRPFNQSSDA